tara:strand:- start:111 stop:482 length:372 start_codon:yes stop_codon:yes gene_type:complete
VNKLLILLWILIPLSVYSSITSALNEEIADINTPAIDVSQLEQKNMQLWCGDDEYMFNTIEKTFKEKPIAVGEVRIGGKLDNPVVGMLVFTYNAFTNRGTMLLSIPEAGKTCLLSHGVNWSFE